MTILVILTGQRASGKTIMARKIAGNDAFRCSGGELGDDAAAFRHAPSDRNWTVDGEAMSELDLERLAFWAQNNQFPVVHGNGQVEQRATPNFIVVDGYTF